MTTNVQHKGSFNINEHFTELMNGVGLDPAVDEDAAKSDSHNCLCFGIF